MSYLHIDNLYKDRTILECYALEKIHGTSAHISYVRDPGPAGKLRFSSGGEDHQRFCRLFSETLAQYIGAALPPDATSVVIYGEAFGGKQQGMSRVYGKDLRFLAFDVKIGDVWLDVPSAEAFAREVELGFVPYARGPLTLEWLDAQRDRDSEVAIEPGHHREGIVIRPIHEAMRNNGRRVIFKHKHETFRETETVRTVELGPDRVKMLCDAKAIAQEYVTPMRLQHVLQRVPFDRPEDTAAVIRAMQEDVRREAGDEIEWSRPVEQAVARATAALLHQPKIVVPDQGASR